MNWQVHTETFQIWNYEIREDKPSEFVKGATHSVVVGIKCPACGVVHDPIEHGESRKCTCGLTLEVWGASLILSR